jgi:hypothetical protein
VCPRHPRITKSDAAVPDGRSAYGLPRSVFLGEFLPDWSVVQSAMEWPQYRAISFSEARAKGNSFVRTRPRVKVSIFLRAQQTGLILDLMKGATLSEWPFGAALAETYWLLGNRRRRTLKIFAFHEPADRLGGSRGLRHPVLRDARSSEVQPAFSWHKSRHLLHNPNSFKTVFLLQSSYVHCCILVSVAELQEMPH